MLTGETARVLTNAQVVDRVASSPSSSNPASSRGLSQAQEEGSRIRFADQNDTLFLSSTGSAGETSRSAGLQQVESGDATASSETEGKSNLLQQVETRIQEALEDASDEADLSVRFRRDEETGSTLVQFVEPDSGDVVRQFPPEDVLKFASRFQDLTGDLFATEVEQQSTSGALVNDQA